MRGNRGHHPAWRVFALAAILRKRGPLVPLGHESFHADDLPQTLRRSKTASMPERKKELGTEVDVTVFRKLKQLAYRTSYSHCGGYYTLDETARFDQRGLWSFQCVWFSRWGIMLDTDGAFVESSPSCYFVDQGAVAEAGAT